MAILNLRHGLAALSAWALALALAFGAALPQPAQAIGPETSGYAQMQHQQPTRGMQGAHPTMASRGSAWMSRFSFDNSYSAFGCEEWVVPCYHPNQDEESEDEKTGRKMGGNLGEGVFDEIADFTCGEVADCRSDVRKMGRGFGKNIGGAIGRFMHNRQDHHQ